MRHGDVLGKLNRPPKQRLSLLANLATYLFTHECILTTLARARELRRYAEKVITLGKRGTPQARLKIFDRLNSPDAGSKVLTVLKERYQGREGGYTRIWKTGLRPSDRAPMALIELVDREADLRKALEQEAAKKKRPEEVSKQRQ